MINQAHLVDEIDINRVKPGTVERFLVAILYDGLSRAVRVPVVIARGKKPGPIFGITSALHGNELNGIPVIHRLLASIDPKKLKGTIVSVIVANTPGFDRRKREFSGVDLNHIMPGKPEGKAAEIYAYRLFKRLHIEDFDYLVDLHTASFGRINSLYVRADMSDVTCSEMACLLHPQIVVHSPPSDYTLRGAAMDHSIPAITVEIGNPQRFQPRYIKSTLSGLRAILAYVKMLPARASRRRPAEPFLCERSFWLRTAHGGLLELLVDITDYVEEGQIVAKLTNIFGDLIAEYKAPTNGVVIGKSVDPVARTGDRILHLGVPANEDNKKLSLPEELPEEVPSLPGLATDLYQVVSMPPKDVTEN